MKHITINMHGGGVFSHLFNLLTNVAVLNKSGVIDLDDVIYVEGRKPDHLLGIAPFNFMDYLLDQSPNAGIVMPDKSDGGIKFRQHPVDYVDVVRDMSWFRQASTMFKFNRDVVRMSDEFLGKHLNTENILGVHIRMTDMNTAHPWLGNVLITDYYDMIDLALSEHPNIERIYLATDNREDARKIADRYGDMVVWRDSKYIMENSEDDHQEIIKQEAYVKQEDTYTNDTEFYTDCMVDALVLMKAKYLVGRTSTLNWFVQCCHLSNFEQYYHIEGSNDIQMDTVLWFGPWKGYTLHDIIEGEDFTYLRDYMHRHFKLPKEVEDHL